MFSSLLGGLIDKGAALLPGGTIPDHGTDGPAGSVSSSSGKSKGKDTKGGDKNGALKKDELKPRTALVQTAPEPPAVPIQPVILPHAWEPPSANISGISSHAGIGAENDAGNKAVPEGTQEVTASAKPLDARASIPDRNGSEPVPSGRLAFTLRLTPANGEAKPVPGSSIPESQTGFGQDFRLATAAGVQPNSAVQAPVAPPATNPGSSPEARPEVKP